MKKWCIDIYHDYDWIKIKENLQKPKVEGNIKHTSEPNLEVKFQIFGSEYEIKHVRLILNTKNKEETEAYSNKHLWKFLNSLEVFTSIALRRPFYLNRLPNSTLSIHSYGEYEDGKSNIPLSITFNYAEANPFDYQFLNNAFRLTFPGLEDYLKFFQKGIDVNLDPEYRWLNFYKMCELRFKEGSNKLNKSADWKNFLNNFENDLKPFLIAKQNYAGLIEKWRASIAHAIVSNKQTSTFNLLATLVIMEKIAQKILNELQGNKGLKFYQLEK